MRNSRGMSRLAESQLDLHQTGNSSGIPRLASEKNSLKSFEFQDPNPAVVLEAAVAADREWGVCVGGGSPPPTKSLNFFLPL